MLVATPGCLPPILAAPGLPRVALLALGPPAGRRNRSRSGRTNSDAARRRTRPPRGAGFPSRARVAPGGDFPIGPWMPSSWTLRRGQPLLAPDGQRFAGPGPGDRPVSTFPKPRPGSITHAVRKAWTPGCPGFGSDNSFSQNLRAAAAASHSAAALWSLPRGCVSHSTRQPIQASAAPTSGTTNQ
jgi:hypothetical protein